MESIRKSSVQLVLGAANIGDTKIDSMARFDTPDQVNAFLGVFSKRGYNQLDTSRMYSPHATGTSEPRIGAVAAGDRFLVDTKVTSMIPGAHTRDKILEEINISLAALKVDQINVQYLHVPDRGTPFEEACEAMTQAHRDGKIKQWGICSYTAEEVQRFVDICEEKGFVKPAVYQGQYNPIVRGGEKELFDVLRKNGMAFYAFSPAAGGFFAGNHKNAQQGGRFDKSIMVGELYTNFYMKPSIMAATDKALEIASAHGISGHAAALRWTAYHGVLSRTYNDAIIIGASSPEQLETNIDVVEQGPLPEDVAVAFEAIYEEIDSDGEIPYHL